MSVTELAFNCYANLRTCNTIKALKYQDWASICLTDFKLWANAFGIFEDNNNTFHRLRNDRSVVGTLSSILRLLEFAVERCIELSKESEPSDDSDGHKWKLGRDDGRFTKFSLEEPQELEQKFDSPLLAEARHDVNNLILRLIETQVFVRRADRSSQILKGDAFFRPARYRNLQKHLELLLRTRNVLSNFERGVERYREILDFIPSLTVHEIIDGVFKKQLRPDQENLIQSNLRRRHRFDFARRHARFTRKNTLLHSKNYRSILTGSIHIDPDEIGRALTRNERPTPSLTMKGSLATITTATIQYPLPPRASQDERRQTFQCPCCSQQLPVKLAASSSQWKKHLATDLHPYTCPIESCKTNATLFIQKESFHKHIQASHRIPTEWRCLFCQDPPSFSSEPGFIDHVSSVHKGFSLGDQLVVQLQKEDPKVAGSQSKLTKNKLEDVLIFAPSDMVSHAELDLPGQCPVCNKRRLNKDIQPFLEHISECIHNFSLIAFPWYDRKAKTLEEEAVDAWSRQALPLQERVYQWTHQVPDTTSDPSLPPEIPSELRTYSVEDDKEVLSDSSAGEDDKEVLFESSDGYPDQKRPRSPQLASPLAQSTTTVDDEDAYFSDGDTESWEDTYFADDASISKKAEMQLNASERNNYSTGMQADIQTLLGLTTQLMDTLDPNNTRSKVDVAQEPPLRQEARSPREAIRPAMDPGLRERFEELQHLIHLLEQSRTPLSPEQTLTALKIDDKPESVSSRASSLREARHSITAARVRELQEQMDRMRLPVTLRETDDKLESVD